MVLQENQAGFQYKAKQKEIRLPCMLNSFGKEIQKFGI